MPVPVPKLITDPPDEGNVKLRIRSDGALTRVFAYDASGKEWEVENVIAAAWEHVSPNHATRATVSALAVEVDVEACTVDLKPAT